MDLEKQKAAEEYCNNYIYAKCASCDGFLAGADWAIEKMSKVADEQWYDYCQELKAKCERYEKALNEIKLFSVTTGCDDRIKSDIYVKCNEALRKGWVR